MKWKFWEKPQLSPKELEILKEKEQRELTVRKQVEDFAKPGDYIEYLGVKMMVTGYHRTNISILQKNGYYKTIKPKIIPRLNVEYMDSLNHIVHASFAPHELKFCRKIPTPIPLTEIIKESQK